MIIFKPYNLLKFVLRLSCRHLQSESLNCSFVIIQDPFKLVDWRDKKKRELLTNQCFWFVCQPATNDGYLCDHPPPNKGWFSCARAAAPIREASSYFSVWLVYVTWWAGAQELRLQTYYVLGIFFWIFDVLAIWTEVLLSSGWWNGKVMLREIIISTKQ